MTDKTPQQCSIGLWDDTIPGIAFDNNGISNYYRIFEKMLAKFPRGEQGQAEWERLVSEIKKAGKNKKYDCIIGVSGGTDSSYLLYVAKNYGLRPLALNFDNGWSSDISVKNIKRMTSALNIDLETYVVNYEEMKDIYKSYMKASLPWVDCPTDLAIKAILYKKASTEGIQHVIIGHDFRSEGFQPKEWTYGDSKQLRFIQQKFGSVKLKSFPYLSLGEIFYYTIIKRIKLVRPFFYIEYEKRKAQAFLQENYGWEYYGGHHHENLFTRFVISDWLPNKFNIDKRIITLSAQVISKELSRDEAIEELNKLPVSSDIQHNERNYIIKKLGLTHSEFTTIWKESNKFFNNYPSYYPFIVRFMKLSAFILDKILPNKPLFLIQMEERNQNNVR